ncbi:MAG TPA: DNA primase large subunit PriL [Methanocorpusculum sp.]|nr:DNA primase large subunit PriL [Methanocorpusculum sp.]
MPVAFKPRPRDLSHYPFLKEAQEELSKRDIRPVGLSKTPGGVRYLDEACARVILAVEAKIDQVYGDTKDDPFLDIVTFVLAKILVKCTKDRRTRERFAKMEARRIYKYLNIETEDDLKAIVCREIGVSFSGGSLSVPDYVCMASKMSDAKWRLINREVAAGKVSVTEDEHEVLIEEKIRSLIFASLGGSVMESLVEEYQPWTDKILAKVQERTLAEFGAIEESAFPPCIQAIIAGAAAGVNLTHSARFSIVAFMNSIGMDVQQIEGIFSRSPDYNPDMTMYQVNHILSNDYVPPSCATMLTHGVCVNKDALCEKAVHPLQYYRLQKKQMDVKKRMEEARAKKLEAKREVLKNGKSKQ